MIRLFFLLMFVGYNSFCQDPQFAQYYAAPLLINPAFAGDVDCYRVGMNSRLQWTGLPGGPFNTSSVYADMNHSDLNSGFGIMALRDGMGGSRITSAEISGLYSFLVPVSRKVNFRLGLQGTLVSRKINYSNLLFEDQFSGTTITSPVTLDPVTQSDRVLYGDVSTGALMFGEDSYWLGFSAHHINSPRQNFSLEESRLPVKYSLHGGYCFFYNKGSKVRTDKSLQISPTFMYKSQGKFDQLDLGVYFVQSSILVGFWYRGVLLKEDEGIRNNDAASVQLGFQNKRFTFVYSYDITTSRLNLSNTHGSHEISILYEFCSRWPQKKEPKYKRLPCPKFQRRGMSY